jgi:hypothetical protein
MQCRSFRYSREVRRKELYCGKLDHAFFRISFLDRLLSLVTGNREKQNDSLANI